MKVISKFVVQKVTSFNVTPGTQKEIEMEAVCNDGTEENKSFSEYTPSGIVKFMLTNPNCKDEFKPGDTYYITMEKEVH